MTNEEPAIQIQLGHTEYYAELLQLGLLSVIWSLNILFSLPCLIHNFLHLKDYFHLKMSKSSECRISLPPCKNI